MQGAVGPHLRPGHLLLAGLYFGGFQFLMPVIGWLLGCRFEGMIQRIDHWIAFLLLALIGGVILIGLKILLEHLGIIDF